MPANVVTVQSAHAMTVTLPYDSTANATLARFVASANRWGITGGHAASINRMTTRTLSKPRGKTGAQSGLLLAAVTIAVFAGAGTTAQGAWNFVTIQDPNDAGNTRASAVNTSRVLVGTYLDSGASSNGFMKTGATYATVDVPGAAMTTASGVNNSGVITGYYTDGGGGVHGFTQTAGVTSLFDDPAAASGSTYATGTNAAGTTVGFFFDGIGKHGFSKTGTTFTTLDVTGTTRTTEARGINASGVIVGTYNLSGTQHGFVDNSGVYTTLDDPFGVNGTVATGIDSAGDISGYYTDGGGVTHGFLDLNGAFVTVDEPNADPGGTTKVFGVSDNLQVAGMYSANGVISGFVADVPEPATLALFALSALGVATLHRRRGGFGPP